MKRYRKMSNEKLLEERQTMFEIAAFNRGQRAFAQKELRLSGRNVKKGVMMYKNITKFELICMRLKIWWLTRKVRKMKKLRAKSQPRDEKGRFIKSGEVLK